MNTELKNAVKATDKDAQYDNSAKRLIGQKVILAQILVKTNDIKQVYSIWVCMNMEENTMSHIHLTKDDLVGTYEWKGNLELFNIVMIGLARELPEHDETYELHRLLGALLSRNLTIDEKLQIIGDEYDIPMEENFRKDVSTMCNLSQGIKEEGIEIGHAEIIAKLYKNGFSAEQIASATDKTIEEIKAIIAGKKTASEG